jgi:hypothetical protein
MELSTITGTMSPSGKILSSKNRNGFQGKFGEQINKKLEEPGYHVWCCSPIDGPDGKVHVFFSRWPLEI